MKVSINILTIGFLALTMVEAQFLDNNCLGAGGRCLGQHLEQANCCSGFLCFRGDYRSRFGSCTNQVSRNALKDVIVSDYNGANRQGLPGCKPLDKACMLSYANQEQGNCCDGMYCDTSRRAAPTFGTCVSYT